MRDALTPATKTAFLLTGRPGVGKTTIIRRAVEGLGRRAGGFYTAEMRAGGRREGFRLVTLDGQVAVLAHINIASPYRVSKYGVDVAALEEVGVAALRRALAQNALMVVDEIGKMELFSAAFRQAVGEALASGHPLVGTIMLAPHPWADQVKRHPRVEVVAVTEGNREQVMARLAAWLEGIEGRG